MKVRYFDNVSSVPDALTIAIHELEGRKDPADAVVYKVRREAEVIILLNPYARGRFPLSFRALSETAEVIFGVGGDKVNFWPPIEQTGHVAIAGVVFRKLAGYSQITLKTIQSATVVGNKLQEYLKE